MCVIELDGSTSPVLRMQASCWCACPVDYENSRILVGTARRRKRGEVKDRIDAESVQSLNPCFAWYISVVKFQPQLWRRIEFEPDETSARTDVRLHFTPTTGAGEGVYINATASGAMIL